MTALPKSHHHGNLGPALIAAGRAILSEGGVLTLRQAAARAGVSHAAPAHHFGNLAGLRSAIAVAAFADFTTAMTSRRDALGPEASARDRLLAICLGYLDFARTNAGLFSLMFNAGDLDRHDPGLVAVSAAAYQVLARACADHAPTAANPLRVETAVWSLVHGFAVLGFSDLAGVNHPMSDVAPRFETVFDLLLGGIGEPTLGA